MRQPLPVLCLLITLVAAHTGRSRAAEAPALPATAPARRLADILRLVNEGQRDSLRAYAVAHFTPGMLRPNPDAIVDFLMGQYEALGGLDVRRVMQSGDEQITALVQGRRATDRWMRLVVGAEPGPPHRVRGLFSFPAAAALADDDGGPVAPADLPRRLADLVDRLAAEGRFAGSVCLSRDGRTLLNRAWGQADREAGVANRTDTRFGIASLGKMFTAVAVAQLIERGTLRYEDRVAKWIPGWLATASRGITVEQLLGHTSGLGDFLTTAMADRSQRYERLADYRTIAAADTPAFTPGTRFRYSNTGYLLLGALIEAVSGEAWDRYLERHVFGPAGMSATRAYRPRPGMDGIATGYLETAAGSWSRNDSLLVGRGTPAGGSASTAEDLVAFGNALRSGTLISEASLRRLTDPRTDMAGTGMLYGLGFSVSRTKEDRRIYGHSGGIPGVGALLEVYEEDDYALAVLSNVSAGAQPVADAWRDLLGRSREREPAR